MWIPSANLDSIQSESAEPDERATDFTGICGECGEPVMPDRIYCQVCGSLLPDPTDGVVITYSTDAGADKRPRHRWVWLSLTLVLLFAILSAAWWTVQRVTDPEPQELLAAASSAKALAIFTELRESTGLAQLQQASGHGQAALEPVDEMLSDIASNNDTRPRLDSYRSLFRGVALLEHLREDQLSEWSPARQEIRAGLSGLSEHDPMGGALHSIGTAAMNAIQDQISSLERAKHAQEEAGHT